MIKYNKTYGPYFPSWVPNFEAPTPYHQTDRQAKLLLANCLSITSVPLEIHDSYIASLRTLRIDHVIDVGPILFLPPGHPSETKGSLTETLSSAYVFKDRSSAAKTLKYFGPDQYPLFSFDGCTFEHAYMQIICAGVKWFRHPHGNRRPLLILEMGMGDGAYQPLEEEDGSDFAVFKNWEDWVLNHQHVVNLPEYARRKTHDGGGGSGDEHERELRNLNKSITSQCLGRRFFLTTQGYMGMEPPALRGVDAVHVPFGSRTPFVVRRRGVAALSSDKGRQRCHTLLGDCYVQGVMNGEITKVYEKLKEDYGAGRPLDGSVVQKFEMETLYLQ